MKSEKYQDDVKSKSLKEAKDEIGSILRKLEKNDADLEYCMDDFKRLIQLNHHIDFLFKKKVKEISEISIKSKKKLKKKIND